jgi:hypothetical protein
MWLASVVIMDPRERGFVVANFTLEVGQAAG